MPDAAANDSAEWHDVDEAATPGTFVGYLDRAAALLRESRGDTMRLLDITPGCTVLDVGCGAGEFLIELAASSTDVRCVGIDTSSSMIETATSRAAAAGVDVSFALGDAKRLDFPDACFDRVNCSRVLVHVEEPFSALQEIARVLSPGGRLAVFEPDFDALMIDSDDLPAAGAVRASFIWRLENPDIGRRLRRLVVATGLDVVDVVGSVTAVTSLELAEDLFHLFDHLDHAVADGTINFDRAERWRSALSTADDGGTFGVSVVGFRVLATKPGAPPHHRPHAGD